MTDLKNDKVKIGLLATTVISLAATAGVTLTGDEQVTLQEIANDNPQTISEQKNINSSMLAQRNAEIAEVKATLAQLLENNPSLENNVLDYLDSISDDDKTNDLEKTPEIAEYIKLKSEIISRQIVIDGIKKHGEKLDKQLQL